MESKPKYEQKNLVKDPLTGLYPDVETYDTGFLKVSDIHTMYYEQSGNPEGKPVLFVHGGPGGGTNDQQRRFFNQNYYRIINFAQRGCGKSTPHANLEENTTWHLVEDMEQLRKHLGIEKWQIFGGSWGSTLGLAYSITHPDRVTEIVLRGIFLLRDKEIQWYYQSGASFIFPDIWDEYLKPIPQQERGDLVKAYHKRLNSSDEKERLEAAQAWSIWQGATSFLLPDLEALQRFKQDDFALAFARIENHYFVNKGFFSSPNWILQNVSKIRHIPCTIVQGRYDVVCPMDSAWALHKAYPEADFIIVPDAGHAGNQPGTAKALIAATDKFGYSK